MQILTRLTEIQLLMVTLATLTEIQTTAIAIESVIAILTILGGMISFYLNSKKMRDTINQDAKRRMQVEINVESIMNEIKEIKKDNKEYHKTMSSLESDVGQIKKELSLIWNRLDKLNSK
ncbi:MAG: hypothetical protein FWC41_00525 [Firmicutes bacterium]|nr:hypothetical protein [Bacillota bacterium]